VVILAGERVRAIIVLHVRPACSKSRQFQSLDLLYGFSCDSLQVSVHSDGGVHYALDLFIPLCPLLHDCLAFLVQVSCMDENASTIASTRWRKRGPVKYGNHLCFCLLPFGYEPRIAHLEKRVAQDGRHRQMARGCVIQTPSITSKVSIPSGRAWIQARIFLPSLFFGPRAA